MKKVLSFILVLSMVLSSFGMAFAAPAKNEIAGHLNEDATLRLADLGIVQGDDRGFALDSNITRAEFAVLLVRALGLEGSANVAKGETQFTDVTVAAGYEWASGAINVATRLGYIQGYGNGKFGPADSIRYEDAITLVVRALGYEPAAQAKGGYPVGYLVVAEQDVKNTKHVEGAQGVAITRGSVFQLLDNSLTKPKMIQVGFGNDTKYVVSGTGKGSDYVSKQTILTTNLGFDEVEGTVVANYRVDKLKVDEIKIAVEKVNGDDADKTTKYSISDKAEADVDAILGLKVSAWYNDAKDELFRYEVITDEDDVVYGTVVSNKEDKNTLKVEVRDGNDSTKKYAWAEKDSKNGIEEAVAYVKNDEVDVEKVEVGSYGRFVLNEYGDVTFAYLFKFDEVGTAVETTKDEIEFINAADADEDVIELDDYKAEDVFVFNPDFSKASLEDIEAGTAIFAWDNSDDELFLVIRNDKVEGKLEELRVKTANNDRVTVGGKNINVAANAIFSDDKADSYELWSTQYKLVEDLVDEEVTVILDLAGRVLVLTTDVNVKSSTIYGVATYLTTGRNPEVTVFTNEGKEIEYKFEDRQDAQALSTIVNSSTDAYGTKFATVSFKVNKDGEIVDNSLKAADIKVENNAQNLTKADDKKYVEVGSDRYYVRENTVLVKVFNGKGELKPSIIKYTDIIEKEIAKTKAIVIGEASKDAKLIVFTDKDFQAVDDAKYGLVTTDVTRRDGEYRVKINVAGEGEAEYIVSARDTVVKGQAIKFSLNNKGQVNVEAAIIATSARQADFKQIDDKDGNYVKFVGQSKFEVVDNDAVVYELKKDGTLDTDMRLSRVNKGDWVLVDGNSDEIKVLLVATKYYEDKFDGTTPETEVSGLITDKVTASNAIVVDDKTTYFIDAKTILTDKDGKVLSIGVTTVMTALNEDDEVEVTAKDGVATTIKRISTKVERDNLAALKVAKADAAKLVKADYTPATWTVLENALKLPETTNAEVVTKTGAINSAITGLAQSDSSKLAEATAEVKAAEDYVEDQLEVALARNLATASNRLALQEAIDAAQDIHDDAETLVNGLTAGDAKDALTNKLAAVQTAIDAAQAQYDVAVEAANVAVTLAATGTVNDVVLPTVGGGYTISVKTTSNALVYNADGEILTNGTSNVVYTVTHTASGLTADTRTVEVTVTGL